MFTQKTNYLSLRVDYAQREKNYETKDRICKKYGLRNYLSPQKPEEKSDSMILAEKICAIHKRMTKGIVKDRYQLDNETSLERVDEIFWCLKRGNGKKMIQICPTFYGRSEISRTEEMIRSQVWWRTSDV